MNKIQIKRLRLEKILWDTQRALSDISRNCKHTNIAGGRLTYSPGKDKIVQTHEGHDNTWNDGCFSVHCQDCDKDFGWWCPVNPKGYCEYRNDKTGYYDENCIHCHIPSERK